MQKIKQLPQHVISKIAAGEVIERPVYAVKELIENSLDAGSTSITVHVEESGLKRITVTDNGEGMSKEDLVESFKPHTTSKLVTDEDLSHIQTLGFRGEALSSIAAISRMQIKSKTKNAPAGTLIILQDGIVENVSPVGMPSGTQITVENLFHSVPVRKKFLKSQRTEFRHIIETVMHFAFTFPQVSFILTHNGKTIFDLPQTDDAFDRIASLLGNDISSHLIPITHQDGYLTISGYIAKPQITSRNAQKQYLFINNRKVTDKIITAAITSAYGTLIEKQSHPISLLFLTLPYEIVDVNIHPRKEEVRFINPQEIATIITIGVTRSLAEHDITFRNHLWQTSVYDEEDVFHNSTNSYSGKMLKDEHLSWKLSEPLKIDDDNLVQMHRLYLVAQTKNGFVLVDQHAAHERIRYEQLLISFRQHKKHDELFVFSKPKLIEFGVSDSALLEEYLEAINNIGFALEHFKHNSFLLRSLPKIFHDRDYKILLTEMLEDLREEKQSDVDSINKRMIAYLACRGAIKAGDTLTKKQSRELLEQLEKTQHNATCPHGRPTKVIVGLDEINKMFKR